MLVLSVPRDAAASVALSLVLLLNNSFEPVELVSELLEPYQCNLDPVLPLVS